MLSLVFGGRSDDGRSSILTGSLGSGQQCWANGGEAGLVALRDWVAVGLMQGLILTRPTTKGTRDGAECGASIQRRKQGGVERCCGFRVRVEWKCLHTVQVALR